MFYLYHIKGKKWGCTEDLEFRLKQQKFTIEDCANIITVGNLTKADQMEYDLNIEYSYKLQGIRYKQSIANNKLAKTPQAKANKKASQLSSEVWKRAIEEWRIKGRKKCYTEAANKKKARSLSKPILQFDMQGNLLKEWPSIKEAKKYLGKGDIIAHLTRCTSHAGGYLWKYKIT